MTLQKTLILLSTLALSFLSSYADCISDAMTNFGCASVVTCTDTTGVCICPNTKRCVWTNSGQQTVNCPCFAGEDDTYDTMKAAGGMSSALKYCVGKFAEYKCGYETTCSQSLDTGTCKCADGYTNCVWNGDIHPNCPCDTSNYPTVSEYITDSLSSCADQIATYNCPTGTGSSISCIQGIGSCQCSDGLVCAWGPGYEISCPCGTSPL